MRLTPYLLVVAACGGSGAAPDAGIETDAAIDGAAGQVAVRVVRRDTGAPDEGVPVLAHRADGALLDRGETDANGNISLPIASGGSVTIFDADYLSGRFATVVAVEPGDTLQFATGHVGSADQPVTVTLPAFAGADSYSVFGAGCIDGSWSASSGTTGTAYARGGCTAWPVIARVVDAQGAVTAYLFGENADWSGGSLTLTGTWQAPSSFTLDLTGFAADEVVLATSTLVFAGGKDVVSDGIVDVATDASGHAVATWSQAPQGLGDANAVVVVRQETGLIRAILDSDGAWRDSASIDAGELAAPAPRPTVTSTDATWAAVTGDADGLFMRFGADDGEWDLIVPPDATSLALPAVPADLAAEIGAVVGWIDVTLFDSTGVDGYADFRSDADATSHRDFLPVEVTGALRLRVSRAFP